MHLTRKIHLETVIMDVIEIASSVLKQAHLHKNLNVCTCGV